MPLILGANSVTGGYEVDNSLRFNSGSSDYLSRTPATTTNQKTWTYSFWIKRAVLGTTQYFLYARNDDNNRSYFRFTSSDTLGFFATSSASVKLEGTITSRVFRDVSAWYHIVLSADTTQATSTNRFKIYVNGTEQTLTLDTTPSLNSDLSMNIAHPTAIGVYADGLTGYLNGYMSEINLIDGQQLDPSDFGEFDEDSGIWKPIAYTGTYGTNGFYLEFKDSSALGDDTSGNGNDFTVNNLTSIDQTTDTPTNNFATLNSIWGDNISVGSMTYSNGNTTYEPTTNGNSYTRSTFGMSNKGKWYAEMKVTEVNTGQSASLTVTPDTNFGASTDSGYGFQVQLNAANTVLNKVVGGTATSINNSFASGSIAMLAVDLDNGKMWVGYNGTWYNDNNPSSTLDVSNPDGTGISTSYDYIYGFQAYWQTGGYYDIADVNFGNPSFAISSGNSDANGYGNFEYAVPSGYFALCTKNLAEYG
jgi:hypothetical protein